MGIYSSCLLAVKSNETLTTHGMTHGVQGCRGQKQLILSENMKKASGHQRERVCVNIIGFPTCAV